jgi:hypothetical protein
LEKSVVRELEKWLFQQFLKTIMQKPEGPRPKTMIDCTKWHQDNSMRVISPVANLMQKNCGAIEKMTKSNCFFRIFKSPYIFVHKRYARSILFYLLYRFDETMYIQSRQ